MLIIVGISDLVLKMLIMLFGVPDVVVKMLILFMKFHGIPDLVLEVLDGDVFLAAEEFAVGPGDDFTLHDGGPIRIQLKIVGQNHDDIHAASSFIEQPFAAPHPHCPFAFTLFVNHTP